MVDSYGAASTDAAIASLCAKIEGLTGRVGDLAELVRSIPVALSTLTERVATVSRDVERVADSHDDVQKRVTDLEMVVERAKGAWWLANVIIGAVGALIVSAVISAAVWNWDAISDLKARVASVERATPRQTPTQSPDIKEGTNR